MDRRGGAHALGWQWGQRGPVPGARAALQPRHDGRTLANFIMPPAASEGVDMWMLRVCAPAHHKACQGSYHSGY